MNEFISITALIFYSFSSFFFFLISLFEFLFFFFFLTGWWQRPISLVIRPVSLADKSSTTNRPMQWRMLPVTDCSLLYTDYGCPTRSNRFLQPVHNRITYDLNAQPCSTPAPITINNHICDYIHKKKNNIQSIKLCKLLGNSNCFNFSRFFFSIKIVEIEMCKWMEMLIKLSSYSL